MENIVLQAVMEFMLGLARTIVVNKQGHYILVIVYLLTLAQKTTNGSESQANRKKANTPVI